MTDSAEIEPETTFELRDDVMTEEIEGELVVLDLEGDVYFSLNDVGRVIWEEAAGGGTLEEIVEAVCAEYDVEEERAEEDTVEFLADVVERELMSPAQSIGGD